MRGERLKGSKNVFGGCVLAFDFAPIEGSVFFIFKKLNSWYPRGERSQSQLGFLHQSPDKIEVFTIYNSCTAQVGHGYTVTFVTDISPKLIH